MPTALQKKRGRRWVIGVTAFLFVPIVFDSILVYSALSDEHFAVEPDYYQKALDWDRAAEQNQRNAELRWTIALAVDPVVINGARTVRAAVLDAEGQPMTDATVVAVAFSHLRAADRRDLEFGADEQGALTASLRAPRPGRWQFRLRAEWRGRVFTDVQDLEIK